VGKTTLGACNLRNRPPLRRILQNAAPGVIGGLSAGFLGLRPRDLALQVGGATFTFLDLVVLFAHKYLYFSNQFRLFNGL
jgi:hypothetical protein